MLTRLGGGRLYDPANGIDGLVQDLYIRDGRIVAAPADPRDADELIDLSGRVVMAGAIDLHTHIGGGKVNIARMMLPEDHAADAVAMGRHPQPGCGPRRAVDAHGRLPLRGNGLCRLFRTGHAAGQCAPGPHGNGRYADGR